jgi:probable H4MPT-linked C1 transfer pathway protein
MNWLAIDVGGANLKLADGLGFALSFPFCLWREPDRLTCTLRELVAQAPPCDHLAVTMTGELADCYETKREGVLAILRSVEQAADGRHTRVYTIDGRLLALAAARRSPLDCAATNWHTLARFAATLVPTARQGLLIDMGSTTTDIIPLDEHGPVTTARTDLQRLARNELLYTGVVRSPVCAITGHVAYRGASYRVAQELFATARDVYTILGDLPEDPCDVNTADGRPATRLHARRRLARVLCADETEFHHRDAVAVAESVRRSQLEAIANCLQSVASQLVAPPAVVIISGAGEFLIQQCLLALQWSQGKISLRERYDARVSACAAAHALAVIARTSEAAR